MCDRCFAGIKSCKIIFNAIFVWMLPGEKGSSCGTANGISNETAIEEDALCGDTVNIGSGNEFFIVSADSIIIMVIAHDVNNIRPVLGESL